MKKHFLLIIFCFASAISFSQNKINAEDISKYIGQTVTICGKIFTGRFFETSLTQPTLLNMGGEYPNHTLTVLIGLDNRKNFSFKPEDYYVNKNVCVTGEIVDYKGKPEIIISDPSEIVVDEADLKLEAEKLKAAQAVILKSPPAVASNPTTSRNPINKTGNIPNNTPRTDTSVNTSVGTKKSTPANNNTVPPKDSVYTVKIKTDINLRSGPSMASGIIAVLKAGSKISVYLTLNGWSYVALQHSYGDQNAIVLQGYIKSSILK